MITHLDLFGIDNQVCEVVLADHLARQFMSIIASSRAGQGLIEDEGGGLGVGQQSAVAQRRRDDGVDFEVRVCAVG
ncbi:hypothetical protein D3C81_1975740 [compost metagenome]